MVQHIAPQSRTIQSSNRFFPREYFPKIRETARHVVEARNYPAVRAYEGDDFVNKGCSLDDLDGEGRSLKGSTSTHVSRGEEAEIDGLEINRSGREIYT